MALIAAAAKVVVGWAVSVTGSATVGAIAGAAAKGAIYGAIIGAGKAAATGENVFDGALKGAAYGGITAGVFSGASMAGEAMFGVGSSAAEQMATMGLSATGAALPETIPTGQGILAQDVGEAVQSFNAPAISTAKDAVTPVFEEPIKKGLLSGVSKEVKAGMATGAFTAAGNVLSANAAASTARELAEQRRLEDEERVRENRPGILEGYKQRLNPPDRWNPKGILA